MQLDHKLFGESTWFAIDRHNRRVPRVIVPTLDVGLSMLGQQRVAALVGRLKPGFVAVDVDLSDWEGHAATEKIVHWAATRGVWTCVRPSGGSDGRHHVILAVGTSTNQYSDLKNMVENLRERFSYSRTALDVRTTLRPFSSPHRTGRRTSPYGALKTLLRTCPTLRATVLPKTARRGAENVPLLPRPRRHRPLPEAWAQYLRDGTKPPINGDSSDSTYEAITTAAMVRAGWSAEEAWEAILTCHPNAMAKARGNQRRWIDWVWNRAVLEHQDTAPSTVVAPEIAHSVERGRQRLEAIAWTFSPRQRPALLSVGHMLLDRMERTNALRVPCPERDLLVDTGLASRRVVRTALRALSASGFGTLHTAALDLKDATTSFEFEVAAVPPPLWEKYPPSFHTPTPHGGHWATLPRAAHQVWRALTRHGRQTPLLLATASLLPGHAQEGPSPSTLRTLQTALTALHQAGLAAPHRDGSWSAPPPSPGTLSHKHQATLALTLRLTRVAEERASWRARQRSTWSRTRTAALARTATRQERWWHSLPAQERAARSALWRRRFEALPLYEQHSLKRSLAQRRGRAGISESSRYKAWINSTPRVLLSQRSVECADRFARLPLPEQSLAVSLWNAHRDEWGLPRLWRPSSTERSGASA